MTTASRNEIRAARAWLQKRGIGTATVSPRRFANSAKELDKGFSELLSLIARLELGGQGQQRERQELIRKSVEAEAS